MASEKKSAAKKSSKPEDPTRAFATERAWEAWLKKNHAKVDGIWIRFAKITSGVKSITYPEALDVALCYGWIDGLRKREDDTYYIQRFTPRRKRSMWSKVNRIKVAVLVKAGRMQAPGHSEIERAKKDGRWEAAYDGYATATPSDDLLAALDASPKAKAFYPTLSAQNRYAIHFRLHSAKRLETRARRLALFIAMLEKGETIVPD